MKVEGNLARWMFVLVVFCSAQSACATTKCTMKFSLSGWSAIYQTARGSGTINCDNGQAANVAIQTKGGGLTFGKSKIVDAKGTFSPVGGINDLFGNYAKAEAHAGAGPSTQAQALTKGDVSLAIAGTGTGINVGIDFGRFTIRKSDAGK